MVKRRRQRGMTLIEVMISLMVATVGLLGSLAMVGSVMGTTAFSRRASEATVLAQARLEELQSLTSANVSAVPDSATPTTFTEETPGVNGAVQNPLDSTGHYNTQGLYTRVVNWQTILDPVLGPRRIVEVQVQWQEADGSTHLVTVAGTRLP